MCIEFLKSSIGRKAVMAVTGGLLYLFVIGHMLGNLQIYLGQDALNDYALHIKSLPFLLWPVRIGLLTVLLLHIHTSMSLALENRSARPVAYIKEATAQASFASRSMVLTGLVILTFIIFHLSNFTFDLTHPQYCDLVDTKGRDDVYSMVLLVFREAWVTASYVVAMGFLALHISHGGASVFQSLGLADEKKMSFLKKISNAVALAVFVGNTSMPLAAYFGFLKLPPGAH